MEEVVDVRKIQRIVEGTELAVNTHSILRDLLPAWT